MYIILAFSIWETAGKWRLQQLLVMSLNTHKKAHLVHSIIIIRCIIKVVHVLKRCLKTWKWATSLWKEGRRRKKRWPRYPKGREKTDCAITLQLGITTDLMPNWSRSAVKPKPRVETWKRSKLDFRIKTTNSGTQNALWNY